MLKQFSNRGVRQPNIPFGCSHNAHLYYLLMPSFGHRDALIQAMKADGIMTPFHYVPLHSSPGGLKFGRTGAAALPITDQVSECLVRLPLFPNMNGQLADIIDRLVVHLDAILD